MRAADPIRRSSAPGDAGRAGSLARAALRTIVAVLVALVSVVAFQETSWARGGGGGKGGGKGRGRNNGRSPIEYVGETERDAAAARRADFLFAARYEAVVRDAADDRDAALEAARERGSAARRSAAEAAAHPL